MLQTHGLRAGSGGGTYIPPEPGDYDESIGGYFAGHMQAYSTQTLSGGSDPESVYQIWVEPKSEESNITHATYVERLSAYFYNQYRRNDQANGYRNPRNGGNSFGSNYTFYGESEWYEPAILELHQIFRYLRPTNNRIVTEGNRGFSTYTNPYYWYQNGAAIPSWQPDIGNSSWPASLANPSGYAPEPYMVENPLFQAGGAQAFETDGWYMSSTVIDQNSNRVNADQIGRAIMTFQDPNPYSAGYIENPIWVKYFDGVNSLGFDISKYALQLPPGELYLRRIKRRTIPVNREYLDAYYAAKIESNGHIGRFKKTYTPYYWPYVF